MMKPYQLLLAPALAVATFGMSAPSPTVGSAPAISSRLASSTAPALPGSGVGDALPAPELRDFMQTGAKSFEDYKGRAVLIEFFEHW